MGQHMKAMHHACMSRLHGLKEADAENAKLRNDQLQLLRRLEDFRDAQKDYDNGLERLRRENDQLRRQQDVLQTKNDMLEGQVNQLVGIVGCSPSWRMASQRHLLSCRDSLNGMFTGGPLQIWRVLASLVRK